MPWLKTTGLHHVVGVFGFKHHILLLRAYLTSLLVPLVGLVFPSIAMARVFLDLEKQDQIQTILGFSMIHRAFVKGCFLSLVVLSFTTYSLYVHFDLPVKTCVIHLVQNPNHFVFFCAGFKARCKLVKTRNKI